MAAHDLAEKKRVAKQTMILLGRYDGNVSAAARAEKINRCTLQARKAAAIGLGVTADTIFEGEGEDISNDFSMKDKGDITEILSRSTAIQTVEDALAFAKIDTMVWEVDRSVINSWEVGAKQKDGTIKKETLWQVKVWLKRIISKPLLNAIDVINKRVKPLEVKWVHNKKKTKTAKPPTLLELCPFDAHFGKHAWGMETGNDYDLGIAKTIWNNAIDDLLDASSHYNVTQIVIPIGQDFFHIDNWNNTTTMGTPQDVDGRWQKIFVAGEEVWEQTVAKCLSIAPVKLLYVPGNHDMTTSFYLSRVLARAFKDVKDVVVNCSPSPRKYVRWGLTLIGYTHGNQEPMNSLPTIMASERPEDWAACKHREWHIGHWHKRKQVHYVSTDTLVGVPVRVMPSLCGTDSWHHGKGYINGTERAAEAYLWSGSGYTGHLSVDARN